MAKSGMKWYKMAFNGLKWHKVTKTAYSGKNANDVSKLLYGYSLVWPSDNDNIQNKPPEDLGLTNV